MSEHERAIYVPVLPDEAFRFLSSVSNLTSFLPYVKSMEEDEDNHVFGVAEYDGRRQELSGFFRADRENYRLDWESDGTPGYRGWLQIEPQGTAGSKITVHLSVQSGISETPLPHPGFLGERIEREFDNVLERLNKILQEQHVSSTR